MSPLQLTILAVAAMTLLATVRLARVRFGRTPLPEGRGRPLFLLAFLVVPPIALGGLIQPAEAAGQIGGVASVSLYAIILAGLAILMGLLALVVRLVAPHRSRRLLLLALVGSDGEPDEVPLDPPLTATLAESVALVDRTNVVFPRGREFPAQVDRAGFRVDWNALDAATRALEGRIADDNRLGLGVAPAATARAEDARGRLDSLRRLAVDRGQAWAAV